MCTHAHVTYSRLFTGVVNYFNSTIGDVGMDTLLEDDTAVVTGGSSGIGRAIALTFAEHGADVVVADVREDPREASVPTHEAIETQTPRDSVFVECDVSDPEALDAAVGASDTFGGIDIMVNNAGVFRDQEFLEVSYDDYRTMMDINASGVFFGAQAAARRMVDNGGGVILNMSSIAGMVGRRGLTTYCASKGAVRAMTYAMAHELEPSDVRVNALHPGSIDTKLVSREATPSYPVGEPVNVADCALFLTSDLAEFVNGASLVVDGGRINFY